MKVRLTQQITGTRDGQPWPAAGEEIDLPESEALALLQGGTARAVDTRNTDVEVRELGGGGVDEGTKAQVKNATITRERQAVSKRAHEPLNLGVAAEEQPAEDDNGPRLPEVSAAVSAKVEDPAVATETDDGPKGAKVSVRKTADK